MHKLLIFLTLFAGTSISSYQYNGHGYAKSLDSMLSLQKLKEKQVINMNDFLNVLKAYLQQVKGALHHMEQYLRYSRNNKDSYNNNYIYHIGIARHMNYDWSKWTEIMRRQIGAEQITRSQKMHIGLPTLLDYAEAVEGIHRLQMIYDLDSADMAGGILRGKRYSRKKWGALECVIIGLAYYSKKLYAEAEYWLELALYYFDDHPYPNMLELMGWKYVKLLELAMETSKASGRYSSAMVYASEALSLEGEHMYLRRVWPVLARLNREQNFEVPPPKRKDTESYKKFCRKFTPPSLNGNNHCYYLRSTPFLQLAPIKVEKLAYDVNAKLFHNILSDAEIEELKSLARPLLHNEDFYNFSTAKRMAAQGRTYKTARIKDNLHKVTQTLNRRIGHALELSFTDSDQLQLINYGLAGYEFDHVNYENIKSSKIWKAGGSIAMAILYLTNMEQGGETLFPLLNLRVTPQKGTLLLFYNLELNTQPDWIMLHISCPIIMGNKWVATKWIWEKPQMPMSKCCSPKPNIS